MSQKKIKAVLFDMDGVLFNSMPYHSDGAEADIDAEAFIQLQKDCNEIAWTYS